MREQRAFNRKAVLGFWGVTSLLILSFVASAPANDAVIGPSKEVGPGQIYEEGCHETPNTATVSLGIEGVCPRGKPADIMLLIDVSSTMLIDARIDSAKASAKVFVDLMRDVDRAGLVVFAHSDTLKLGLTDMDDAGKAVLKARIDNLIPQGYTDIGDAIFAANQEIQDNGRGGDTLGVQILLTDGEPNMPTWVDDPTEYALEAAAAAQTLGIEISTIGLALTRLDAITLLQDIASTTNGQYYDSPTPEELHDIYVEIAQPNVCDPLTEITIHDVLQPYIHLWEPHRFHPTPSIPVPSRERPN